jgi:hypothetical protein
MRPLVIGLNIASVLAALLIMPIALYVGAWGLLGPAYGRTQDAILGIAIMAAPVVITVLCVTFSIRAMRRGLQYAPVVASLPLLVAIVAFLNSPFASSLGR